MWAYTVFSNRSEWTLGFIADAEYSFPLFNPHIERVDRSSDQMQLGAVWCRLLSWNVRGDLGS